MAASGTATARPQAVPATRPRADGSAGHVVVAAPTPSVVQEGRPGPAGLHPLHVVPGNPYLASVMALSTDGDWLITGCEDRSVTLLKARTGAVRQTLEGHEGAVKSIAISSSGQWAASAEGEIIKLWNVETGKSRDLVKRAGRFAFRGGRKNEGHLQVTSLCFSPDEGALVSVGADRAGLDIKSWEVKTGALAHEFSQEGVSRATFSPRGDTLAAVGIGSAGDHDAVRLWNIRTGALKGGQIRQEGSVIDVSFSWNGRLLAVVGSQSGSIPAKVDVWDMTTGKKVRSWTAGDLFGSRPKQDGRGSSGGPVAPTCVAFAPDNDTLVVGGGTISQGVHGAGHMAARSVATGAGLWDREERGLGLTALNVSSDGLVATATRHAVKMWQLM